MNHESTERNKIEQNKNFRGHQLSKGKLCFVQHTHMHILHCNVICFSLKKSLKAATLEGEWNRC